jgi:hypothetical protein
MILTLALVLALDRTAADGCAFQLADAERTKLDALTRELRDAEERSAKAPAEGATALRDALEHASADPVLLAKSDAARRAQLYARLALVRSLLATGDREAAAGLLDEMLAVAGAEPLPAKLFGPSVMELHAERTAAHAKLERAEVVVQCASDCVAIASDTLLGCADAGQPLHVQLPTGSWRVTVAEIAAPDHRTVSELQLVASQSATMRLETPADRAPPEREPGKRKLPRWAGILGMSIGAAAMITGGVLLGVDGKCPDLKTDPMGTDACSQRLNTDVPGIAMLVSGAAVFTGFTIPFAIGEHRARKRRR